MKISVNVVDPLKPMLEISTGWQRRRKLKSSLPSAHEIWAREYRRPHGARAKVFSKDAPHLEATMALEGKKRAAALFGTFFSTRHSRWARQ
jgi:hypothetical protein